MCGGGKPWNSGTAGDPSAMSSATPRKLTLDGLRVRKNRGEKFSMLTAYDCPTARVAAAAGVDTLLVGDSLGSVLLGHPTTRPTPFELMLALAEAVRRGAPHVWLAADVPYESAAGGVDAVLDAARRYRAVAGVDAVKVEVAADQVDWLPALAGVGVDVIAHLGLRPQSVERPEDYRAQARDAVGREALVRLARETVAAGAHVLLLEAVAAEAAAAVVDAVDVPVIGCGAGPACDGHVVVTHDLLGLLDQRAPRFVPQLAELRGEQLAAMRRWHADIVSGRYPDATHVYGSVEED